MTCQSRVCITSRQGVGDRRELLHLAYQPHAEGHQLRRRGEVDLRDAEDRLHARILGRDESSDLAVLKALDEERARGRAAVAGLEAVALLRGDALVE